MQPTQNEVWKPVVGFEGLHEVSDHGRVRSVERVVIRSNGVPQRWPEQMRKPQRSRTGHLVLTFRAGGRTVNVKIHRLVAEAFLGPAPEGKPYVLHWDDDPANNHVSNLRWGDNVENSIDKIRNGRDPYSKRTHCPLGHPLTRLTCDPTGGTGRAGPAD